MYKAYLTIIMLCFSFSLSALDTTEFTDANMQKRYATLNSELRCLVCQNETIAASSSELAQDLRAQVAEQIRAGKSDTEIRAYMSERYGDFIHYRPPNSGNTKLLWIAPMLLIGILLLIFILIIVKKQSQMNTEEENSNA